ncbi:MAG: T9SS type A sorting domain-containing protein [Bacteroidetes bacterium]|nr:T9SS type A sorting domain-containing protein [Bacteroidota bacterium]
MKRCFFLLFAGLLFAGSAHAQLRFTRADIEGELIDRDLTIFSTPELSGVTFNLGAAGGGQVYDFSGFTFQQSTYQTAFISPDVTPYGMDFPAATHAQILGDASTFFSYTRLDDIGYYDLGYATEISDVPYILKYDPEMPSFKFPVQLGASWSYSGNEVQPMEGFFHKTDMQIEVVSEGILTTTMGSWPALCIRNREQTTDRIEFAGMVVSEEMTSSVNYMFLTKSGVSASLTVDTLDAASWNPRVLDAGLTFSQLPSAVHSVTAPDGFGIASVYPHPVTGGSTVVAWQTDGPAVLTLHDNCGRELRRIAQDAIPGLQQQTRLSVQDLPAGMYFVRLTRGNAVSQKPLLILR